MPSNENIMRSVRHSRKPDLLHRDQFRRCHGSSARVHRHANASENSPRLAEPDNLKNQERILRHQARRLVAMDENLKLSVLFRRQDDRGFEAPLRRFELSVR